MAEIPNGDFLLAGLILGALLVWASVADQRPEKEVRTVTHETVREIVREVPGPTVFVPTPERPVPQTPQQWRGLVTSTMSTITTTMFNPYFMPMYYGGMATSSPYNPQGQR